MLKAMRAVSESALVRVFALVGLFSLMPLNQIHSLSAMKDYDIWWHTRVGHWILRTHSFPHVGLFSRIGEARPWIAYSWGFEVVMACLQSVVGLLSAPLFVIAMDVVIVFVLFFFLWRLSSGFWWSWLLAYVAIWGMDLNWVGVGRPVMFSVLFFLVELGLIFVAISSGCETGKRNRSLYWLPVLFVVWANCHIQFIYGLGLLGLFALVTTVEYLIGKRQFTGQTFLPEFGLKPAVLWGIFVASVVATLLNPYGIGLYRVVFHYAAESNFAFAVVNELKALTFRRDTHFVELLLALMAFFAMGRRKVEPFKLALMIAISIISFRSGRDAWFLCIASAAVIASSLKHKQEAAESVSSESASGLNRWQLAGALAGSLGIVLLAGLDAQLSERNIMRVVQNTFPLDAVAFVEKNHPPGPLFNQFDWGGFLIATMPDYPVSIDGRTDLYGDELMRREADSANGLNLDDDPAFKQANVFFLPASIPLCRVLEQSPHYDLIYADRMAMVFVRKP